MGHRFCLLCCRRLRRAFACGELAAGTDQERNMTGRELSSRRSERPALADMTGVADVVKNIRGKASEQASAFTQTLTQTLREHGQTLMENQKSRAAAEIQHLGAAVRTAADRLHDQQSEALARYVDTAAESLDGVARYVEEMNLAAG
jgi:hypothetical protein